VFPLSAGGEEMGDPCRGASGGIDDHINAGESDHGGGIVGDEGGRSEINIRADLLSNS
jgi:hypothetical protein